MKPPSSLSILCAPYVFSQYGPLGTSQLIRDARRLGLKLNADRLTWLHSQGALSPLAAVTDQVVGTPTPPGGGPTVWDSSLIALRLAQETGRIFDPTDTAPPRNEALRFDERKIGDPPRWWNGLIYSRWQLLNADRLGRIASPTAEQEAQTAIPPYNDEYSRDRSVALAVTLLEARYLPEIEPGWHRLRGVDDVEWYQWRNTYDTAHQVALLQEVGVSLADIHQFAEGLLVRAHFLDPSGQWGALLRRAPAKKWDSLKDHLALAMEQRQAAEILLRFYADAGGELPLSRRTVHECGTRWPIACPIGPNP